MSPPDRLRIVHIVRSPIGGIFRHIVDLATAQAEDGHDVGIVCDSSTGGDFEDRAIAAIRDRLTLGASRIAMRRQISPADLRALRDALGRLDAMAPHVIHGHGAKGGAYGRMIGTWLNRRRPVARLYAPHGGSLHYDAGSLSGQVYFGAERMLEAITDAIVHVSAYEAETYRRKVGVPRCRAMVIRNGLRPAEFEPVVPRADAADLLYLGMFRDLKGVDVLLQAIALLEARYGRRVTAHLVGQADAEFPRYEAMTKALRIADRVTFHDPKPTRVAFELARAIVVPSRAESMPYVVLEAIAADLPMVATRVGGIPEIFGPHAGDLVAPGDPDALAAGIERLLSDQRRAAREAGARREAIRESFAVETMHRTVVDLYREILTGKEAPGFILTQLRHLTSN